MKKKLPDEALLAILVVAVLLFIFAIDYLVWWCNKAEHKDIEASNLSIHPPVEESDCATVVPLAKERPVIKHDSSVPVQIDIPDPVQVKEPIMTYLGEFYVTGYDTCIECCLKTDGITASGVEATVERTCAAYGYPFGTKLYIEGSGTRSVEDRGPVVPNHIDILCADHPECFSVTGYYNVYLLEDE